MRKILIVKEDGMIRVTVAYGVVGCDQAYSCTYGCTFRRFSHRAWGFIRRAMREGAEA